MRPSCFIKYLYSQKQIRPTLGFPPTTSPDQGTRLTQEQANQVSAQQQQGFTDREGKPRETGKFLKIKIFSSVPHAFPLEEVRKESHSTCFDI